MDAVDRIHEVGDMEPWGRGPNAEEVARDPTFETAFPGDYLRRSFPSIDFFTSCSLDTGAGAGAAPEAGHAGREL